MDGIIPEQMNSMVQAGGWIPLDRLGEGGGATVYLCAKVEVVRIVQSLMQSGSVRDPQKDSELAGRVVRTLALGIGIEKNALAAVKVPKAMDEASTIERLKREIAAMRTVKHQSLIRLLDFDKEERPRWFAMEFHRSGTLKDVVKQYTGRVIATLEAVIPIVEAVAALHEKKFIHRDIKPTNIFVADNGHLILGDFGIVFPSDQTEERLTEKETPIISRDWIPDWGRFTDAQPQPQIDIFMLAKVVYFMVTGGEKVLASQLDEPPYDLNQRLPGQEGSAELQKLLLECITTKERDCKFSDARTFLSRLRELLNYLRGTTHVNLVFSYLSVHSTTDVPIRRSYVSENPQYPSLTRLQAFFSNGFKTLRVRVRVAGPPRISTFSLFLTIDGRHMTSPEGWQFEMTPSGDRGAWNLETTIAVTVPLAIGWHAIDIVITSDSDGSSVTGLMLYGA